MVLAGGFGTRLGEFIGHRPKPLAIIHGRPFLDLLVDELIAQQVTRIILCVGYLREQIIAHYRKRSDAEFLFSEEAVPLGTGGAVKGAAGLVRSDLVMILNGDSFCEVRFSDFLAFHESKQANVSMVLADSGGRTDGGSVEIADDGRILRFLEKSAAPAGRTSLINAGIYLMPKSLPVTWALPAPFSLERDVFPRAAMNGNCFGFRVNSELIDIGTPDRYREAQQKLRAGKASGS
jgi:D-glycero-alpha-D-manno-heptose 1-phosphate guanylyltransferase